MLKAFKRTLYNVLTIIVAPPFCAYCKTFLTCELVLCIQCKNTISPIVSITRSVTQKYSMKIFAISDYQDPLKKLILAKRWGNRTASKQLGQLLWQLSHIKQVNFDYIVPIPLHWTRFARRGFNQAEEIAQIIAEKSGKPVINILKRSKRTAYQSQSVYTKRNQNVENAFIIEKLDKAQFKNKHLLLIDDLMTTGATLQVAARTLLQLKPQIITAAVVCRVI
ncbi:MAG: phosphoribosyltransferase family protein [Candidatus Babeliales bacterium]